MKTQIATTGSKVFPTVSRVHPYPVQNTIVSLSAHSSDSRATTLWCPYLSYLVAIQLGLLPLLIKPILGVAHHMAYGNY